MNGSKGRSPWLCVRSWIMSQSPNASCASAWSATSRAASSGSSSRVTSAAAEVTARNLAASRSLKIAPQVNFGTSRMATVSGNSTAELVS
jgi:hypothetical protein